MNSAAATFHVQGHQPYAVRSLVQHMHQDTLADGTICAHPTSGELRMVLDVVAGDVLLPTWAYSPNKALPAFVVFAALDGGSQSLTLVLDEACCIAYDEHFEPARNGQQALYCAVSIVARRIVKHGVEYHNHWSDPTR